MAIGGSTSATNHVYLPLEFSIENNKIIISIEAHAHNLILLFVKFHISISPSCSVWYKPPSGDVRGPPRRSSAGLLATNLQFKNGQKIGLSMPFWCAYSNTPSYWYEKWHWVSMRRLPNVVSGSKRPIWEPHSRLIEVVTFPVHAWGEAVGYLTHDVDRSYSNTGLLHARPEVRRKVHHSLVFATHSVND